MALSKEDLEKVLTLSHLHIDESEKQQYLPQLQSILAHMDSLSGLDLEAISPSAWVGDNPTPRREDTVIKTELPYTEENAPDWENNGFAVPKII